MSKSSRLSSAVRERAVRLVREHEREHASQWPAITSKIGCLAETLRHGVRLGEREASQRPGLHGRAGPAQGTGAGESGGSGGRTQFSARRRPILPRRTSTAVCMPLDSLHRPARRGGHPALRGQSRGLVRQRAGGDRHGLVQHGGPAGIDELSSVGGGRGAGFPRAGQPGDRARTCLESSPENPGRVMCCTCVCRRCRLSLLHDTQLYRQTNT